MPATPLNILFVVSEALPFAKTGGLADVAGSLPVALHERGHDVRLVLPWYRTVREKFGALRRSRHRVAIPLGGQVRQIAYRQTDWNGVPVYFLDAPDCYDRPGLYGEQGRDYPDNALRFGLLGRGALELCRHLEFCPAIVHAHDWQAAMAPISLRQHLWADPFFARTGSLLTIHNLGYQGLFPYDTLRQLGLDSSLFNLDQMEFFGQVSLLKGGIVFADRISTVSPTYCEEIQTPAYGMGLDGLLRARKERLHGILNGLDTDLWNPAEDQALAATYTAAKPGPKATCKKALQTELGLQTKARTPLAAMVARLDPQKGIDLLIEQWPAIMERDLQLVILGTGQPEYERRLAELVRAYPGRAVLLQSFDEPLARRIYAGSDLFLMPSRYEPCGLGQLIALRYGTIPLVHATGGLADTITDPRDNPASANGYRFEDYASAALLEGLDRILAAYHLQDSWTAMRQRAMRQDLSWQAAAGKYEQIYRQIMEDNRV